MDDATHLLHLLQALLKWSTSHFERLVLHACEKDRAIDPYRMERQFAELEDFLLPFTKRMHHLVALCLIGLPIESTELFHRQITEEVLPLRPAFWYYLGAYYPEENDVNVPRIHYDEILFPINPFDSPPTF